MIRFEEALERLLHGVRAVGTERVSIDDAPGRVLAEDLVASVDLPAFDHSSMDGYAFAAADFEGEGPWEMHVHGESAAGGSLPALERGTACRIFTGARLPVGSDTILPQEDVERVGSTVRVAKAPVAGRWVRKKGADLAKGGWGLGCAARGSGRGTRRWRRGWIGRRCWWRAGRW
ncbi:MAG: hypothetical protein R3F14_32115 [Polyangiaceae bacterium]